MNNDNPILGGPGSRFNPFADLDQFDAIQNSEQTPRETEHEELKQRTIEWYLARWDKFTGSNIPDLMKSGRGKGEEWGETAKGVILQIAAYQSMTDEGREMYSIEQMYKDFPQTRWGNKYEPEARTEYAKATGYIVKECGFRVHPQIPYFGGSFDGEVVGYQQYSEAERDQIRQMLHDASPRSYTIIPSESQIEFPDHSMGTHGIIEIKCPADPIKHLKNRDLSLSGGITVKHEYYGQIQGNIEVAGVNWCDFVSYDPRCKEEYRLVIIRVMRDQIYIDAVLARVREGKRILDGYMAGTSMDEVIKSLNAGPIYE